MLRSRKGKKGLESEVLKYKCRFDPRRALEVTRSERMGEEEVEKGVWHQHRRRGRGEAANEREEEG